MEEGTNIILDILRISIPAILVAAVAYSMLKKFLERDYKLRLLELRHKSSEVVTPIRLQAYERIVLLLERITPSNLLLRVSGGGHTAAEYHRILLTEIRNEFNHNMSQQVYMTEQSWQKVRHAREEVVNLINKSFQSLDEKAKGTELAKRILENVLNSEIDPTAKAISYLKQEIGQVF
ncbi:hypothetical protein [uncultured Pontibacter sp.]|uniref:DUF7935 family protein n=1 Tax=uncultured Pontibacter sp. TaxID=453356 RepID=UPI00260F5D20|nr:hypothetical protein [uncultured Pontibacter sp.]